MNSFVWLLFIQLCSPGKCETVAIKGPFYQMDDCIAEIVKVDRPARGLCERRQG